VIELFPNVLSIGLSSDRKLLIDKSRSTIRLNKPSDMKLISDEFSWVSRDAESSSSISEPLKEITLEESKKISIAVDV